MNARKTYEKPVVTRVKLEDRAVVAQTACKDSPDSPACGGTPGAEICLIRNEAGDCEKSQVIPGTPGFDISPS